MSMAFSETSAAMSLAFSETRSIKSPAFPYRDKVKNESGSYLKLNSLTRLPTPKDNIIFVEVMKNINPRKFSHHFIQLTCRALPKTWSMSPWCLLKSGRINLEGTGEILAITTDPSSTSSR